LPEDAFAAPWRFAFADGARPSDAQVRAVAERVLERQEFAQYRTRVSEAELDFLRWLRDWLDSLPSLYDDSPVVWWLLLAGLSAVALLLVAHVVYTIRLAMRASAGAAQAPRAQVVHVDDRAHAEALAREGHYLAAARVLELASVQALVECGHLELWRHEPNRVLCARIERATSLPGALRGDLVGGIRAVERAWFRERTDRVDLYQDWRRTFERVQGLARIERAA